MKHRITWKNIFQSLSVRLIGSMFIIIIPIITVLIFNNFASRNTLLSQIEDTHSNMLRSYLAQVDNQLKNAMTFSVSHAIYENDPMLMAYSSDEAAAQYARIRLQSTLDERILSDSFIDGYFAQIIMADGYTAQLFATNSASDSKDRVRIKGYLSENAALMDAPPFSSEWQWQTVALEGTHYLFQAAAYRGDILIGSYVNLGHLQRWFSAYEPESTLLCQPADMLDALLAGRTAQERPIYQASETAPFFMAEIMNEEELLNALPFMQKYTIFVTVFLLLTLPLVLIVINQLITKPLLYMIGVMRRIQAGDLTSRIKQVSTSSEIRAVNTSFNCMIDQVEHLKIGIYEEQLKAQHAQLKTLQMQIRPHFLINALNMIYNAIQSKDTDTAKRLLLHSVDFFRYMVKVDADFVPLQEEIAHVHTYLEIQSIRYQEKFTYAMETDPMIADLLIPPLMLQTFAENFMKYVIGYAPTVHLRITVESFEVDFMPYARVRIADTGPGYPADQLALLNSGQAVIDRNGEHIGIVNLLLRLTFFYCGKATWHFANDGGAVAEFTFPATFPETDE